jgi:hypothetical protein
MRTAGVCWLKVERFVLPRVDSCNGVQFVVYFSYEGLDLFNAVSPSGYMLFCVWVGASLTF